MSHRQLLSQLTRVGQNRTFAGHDPERSPYSDQLQGGSQMTQRDGRYRQVTGSVKPEGVTLEHMKPRLVQLQ